MRQVIQNYRTGEVSLSETPAPLCPSGGLLVRNRTSLISLGTERSVIELGRRSLVGKAVARPDLVKRVIEKARRDGIKRTYDEAMGRLEAPTPLGYSSAGVVVEAGPAAHGFKPGDRVACIGQGVASHADFVAVPKSLAVVIPPGVDDDEAAFGMLGIIALHGVRMAKLEFGAVVAVQGLGLLGLISLQLLRAYGCRVICMDPSAEKVALALRLGAEAAVTDDAALENAVAMASGGVGCDAVLMTASATSAEPIHTAVKLSRHKGRIVVVGVADIHPHRNELWAKEVELVVSRAGGPGSLDPAFERDGVDLPIGEVRWTQTRNLAEFLRLVGEGKIDLKLLMTHRYPFAEAERAYGDLVAGKLGGAIGVVLEYPHDTVVSRVTPAAPGTKRAGGAGALRVGAIGAGLFGRSILLPTLSRTSGVSLTGLAAASGASAGHNARRFGFARAYTDAAELFADPEVDAVVAATPHDQHAWAVLQALATGKALFLEKPLCVTPEELAEIRAAVADAAEIPAIMVGHNRRYSPHTVAIRSWLAGRKAPMVMSLRINAGFVPADHWVHSYRQGRSRIVGEMTHFLDLVLALSGSTIRRVQAARVAADNAAVVNNDNLVVSLELTDGSVASLVYSAQGSRSTPREQLDIWTGGATIVSVDFTRSVMTSATGRRKQLATGGAKAGYAEELAHFRDAASGAATLSPPLTEAMHVMAAAFAIEQALATGAPVELAAE